MHLSSQSNQNEYNYQNHNFVFEANHEIQKYVQEQQFA